MKKLKFYEEDVLQVVYNILACMESETTDLDMYLKKTNAPKDITADDIFDTLESAIQRFEKINK